MLMRIPAGINKNCAAEDTEEGDWEATFAINTKGVFLCCQVRAVRLAACTHELPVLMPYAGPVDA